MFNFNGFTFTTNGGAGFTFTTNGGAGFTSTTTGFTSTTNRGAGSAKFNSQNHMGLVEVDGNVELRNGSNISGSVSAKGNVELRGNSNISGSVSAKGNVELRGGSNISGPVSAEGNVELRGGSNISGPVSVEGRVRLCGSRVNVSKKVEIYASGGLDLQNSVIEGNVSAQGFVIANNSKINGILKTGIKLIQIDTSSYVKEIVVEEYINLVSGTASDCKQTIEIGNGSTVGNISFASGHGEVLVQNGSKVTGSVTGGKVIYYEGDKPKEAGQDESKKQGGADCNNRNAPKRFDTKKDFADAIGYTLTGDDKKDYHALSKEVHPDKRRRTGRTEDECTELMKELNRLYKGNHHEARSMDFMCSSREGMRTS